MTSSEKFLFGDDFSIPDKVRLEKKRKAEEPVVPMFTEEQVAQIKAAAFDDGRQSGMQEAQQAAHTALNNIMQQMLDGLHQSMSYLEQYARFNEQEAIKLSYAIARKIVPHAMEKYPRAEIEALLHDCLEKMHSEPRIIIRINSDLQDEVNELIDGIAQQTGFEGRILLRGEPNIAQPDIQIEWTNGGVSRTLEDVVKEIEDIVSAYMAPAEEINSGASSTVESDQINEQNLEARADMGANHGENPA